ncbi:MAG: TraR/DksA family transcriptional regulator [Rhabdochlamydiaceae bacterium]|nr:TraR/DksA family transcriptional regulator [Rhabdochlamydiaceae bacterium]
MPLTNSEIEQFKKKLEELKEQITCQVRGVNETVKVSEEGMGHARHQDEGTEDSIRSVSFEVSDKDYQILRQIERALEKINENTYGICDLTEEEIPKPRLEAIPYATMTVKAQDKLEKGLI